MPNRTLATSCTAKWTRRTGSVDGRKFLPVLGVARCEEWKGRFQTELSAGRERHRQRSDRRQPLTLPASIDLNHSVAETNTEGASIIQWVRSGIYTELALRRWYGRRGGG